MRSEGHFSWVFDRVYTSLHQYTPVYTSITILTPGHPVSPKFHRLRLSVKDSAAQVLRLCRKWHRQADKLSLQEDRTVKRHIFEGKNFLPFLWFPIRLKAVQGLFQKVVVCSSSPTTETQRFLISFFPKMSCIKQRKHPGNTTFQDSKILMAGGHPALQRT